MAHFIRFEVHQGQVVHYLNLESIVHLQASVPPKESGEAGGGVMVQFLGGGSLRFEGPTGISFLEEFNRHLAAYDAARGVIQR